MKHAAKNILLPALVESFGWIIIYLKLQFRAMTGSQRQLQPLQPLHHHPRPTRLASFKHPKPTPPPVQHYVRCRSGLRRGTRPDCEGGALQRSLRVLSSLLFGLLEARSGLTSLMPTVELSSTVDLKRSSLAVSLNESEPSVASPITCQLEQLMSAQNHSPGSFFRPRLVVPIPLQPRLRS
jgi:hypothetical protein